MLVVYGQHRTITKPKYKYKATYDKHRGHIKQSSLCLVKVKASFEQFFTFLPVVSKLD
jgi:hypothetical protein